MVLNVSICNLNGKNNYVTTFLMENHRSIFQPIHLTSFDQNGYSEFTSVSMDKEFKLGISFKTVNPTGLILLSTFAVSVNISDLYNHLYAYFLCNPSKQLLKN